MGRKSLLTVASIVVKDWNPFYRVDYFLSLLLILCPLDGHQSVDYVRIYALNSKSQTLPTIQRWTSRTALPCDLSAVHTVHLLVPDGDFREQAA